MNNLECDWITRRAFGAKELIALCNDDQSSTIKNNFELRFPSVIQVIGDFGNYECSWNGYVFVCVVCVCVYITATQKASLYIPIFLYSYADEMNEQLQTLLDHLVHPLCVFLLSLVP